MVTQEQFDEAVLTLTGTPEWDIIVQGLANDIYHTQCQALDAADWGAVKELKGFASGLSYVINLRSTTITVQSNLKDEAPNADL